MDARKGVDLHFPEGEQRPGHCTDAQGGRRLSSVVTMEWRAWSGDDYMAWVPMSGEPYMSLTQNSLITEYSTAGEGADDDAIAYFHKTGMWWEGG